MLELGKVSMDIKIKNLLGDKPKYQRYTSYLPTRVSYQSSSMIH